MELYFSARFKKNFENLPLKVQKQFEKRIGFFLTNQRNPLLKNHPLKGNLVGLRAFSVSGDYRVIFKIIGIDSVKLIDIGTHAQVY